MLDVSKLENVKERKGGTVARCPACFENGEDKTGDHLMVYANGKFGCIAFAGRAGVDHRKRIHALVGINEAGKFEAITPKSAPRQKPARPLPVLRAPSADELRQIATGRGWHSLDGLDVLVERGLLLVGGIYDDGTTHHAWVATDPSRAIAQARKFDRAIWTHIDAKAKSLPGTTASRCIGASVIGARQAVWMVEGTPDLCAAPIVARLAGLDLDQIAFVCITGAGNALHDDDLPHFVGKRIVIAVHADGAGGGAAARWAEQLYRAGAASVEGFKFSEGTKDLAEYLEQLGPKSTTAPAGLCPTCWSRRIAATIGGPTCSCKTYVCPLGPNHRSMKPISLPQ